MAPGPNRANLYGARIQTPSLSIFLDSATAAPQNHICYWTRPPSPLSIFSSLSPSKSIFFFKFLHPLFSVWTFFFYSLNLLLTFQLDPTFFSKWGFFFFHFEHWEMNLCSSLQEHWVNCYHSPVNPQVLRGLCQLPTTAAHTTNPYSMYDIKRKVLLHLKRRLIFLWSGRSRVFHILHLPSVHRERGVTNHFYYWI